MLISNWLQVLRYRLAFRTRRRRAVRRRLPLALPRQAEVLEERTLLAGTAVDDSATMINENTAIQIDVLANDLHDSGETLTIVDVSTASHGRVQIETVTSSTSYYGGGSSQVVKYRPIPGFAGTDSFTYTIEDGSGAQSTATVTVTVNANQPPSAVDDSASGGPNESVTVDVLANDSDPEGHAFSLSSFTQPEQGTVAQQTQTTSYYGGSQTVLVYTPPTGFAGTATFTYTVEDEIRAQSTATVSVSIAVNQPPSAVDDSASGGPEESVTVDVLANDSDPEGHAIALESFTRPEHGTVTLQNGTSYYSTGPTLLYTPDAGFSGTDSFQYVVEDELGAQRAATVTISIAANNPPSAVDDSASTTPDTPVTIDALANDSDPDGHAITIANYTQPSRGTVTLGADGYSSTSYYSGGAQSFTYTPAPGFAGTDTFSYTIEDELGAQHTATVTVTVTGNQAPVATDDAAMTEAGQTVTIDVLANDQDADSEALSIAAFTQPAQGSVALQAGGPDQSAQVLVYTPAAGFAGTETFTYTAEDGSGAQSTATVSVSVVTGSPPVFDTASYTLSIAADAAFGTVVGTVHATDADGDPITYASDSAWPFRVDESTGEITVYATSALEQGQQYVFTVSGSDGQRSDTTAVTIDVLAPNNQDPTFNNGSYTFDVPVDVTYGTLVGTVSAADPELNDLSYSTDWSWPFAVDAATGDIYVYYTDELAVGQQFTFDVWVTDDAGSDSVPVTINIIEAAGGGTLTTTDSTTAELGRTDTDQLPSTELTTTTSFMEPSSGDTLSATSDPSLWGNPDVNEADVYTLHFDSGGNVVLSWDVDWGDGTVQAYEGLATQAQHVYRDGDANYVIRVVATVSDGTSGPYEGRTRGFWRQPHHSNHWHTYKPSDDYETIFGVSHSQKPPTLLDALKTNGGGLKQLWAQSTAALLNAAHPNLNYQYTISEIISMVQDAYATGDYETAKDLFDTANNAGGDISSSTTSEVAINLEHPLLVKNVPPTLVIAGDPVSLVHTEYPLGLSSSDPGLDTITHWTIDWGDGTVATVAGDPSSAAHTYTQLGTYTITGTATDEDGTFQANSLVVDVVGIRLVEETNFAVDYSLSFTVPDDPAAIAFQFADLDFDFTDTDEINDAFELALVDQFGNPLAATTVQGRDAFFNITEGESPLRGAATSYDPLTGVVTVDISHLTPGTEATLIARLVNDDDDTTTAVTLVPHVAFVASPFADPSTNVPFGYMGRSSGNVDPDHLTDVSPSVTVEYENTSFHEDTNRLHAGVTLTNDGTYPIVGPVLVAVKSITAPRVTVAQADGFLPDGTPYYDVSHLIPPGNTAAFDPGEVIRGLDLMFQNPDEVQFDYELVILGHINQGPEFTSDPVVEVAAGARYHYDSHADDPENDELVYSLIFAPEGMEIDQATGALTWQTDSTDEGRHQVTIRATDPYGLYDDQTYSLLVTDYLLNRPPRFTSTPVIDAYVNVEYVYDSDAFDIDNDTLTYSVLPGAPEGFTIHAATGVVTWTAPAELVGQYVTVTLQADDGNAAIGGGTDEQTYTIYVHPEPGNAPPEIISEPSTHHIVPGFVGPATGVVSPTKIDLELGPDEPYPEQVQIQILTNDGSGTEPPTGPDDLLTVYNETDELKLRDVLLLGGGSGINVTGVNLAGHENASEGWATSGIYVNNNETYGMSQYGIVLTSGNAADYGTSSNYWTYWTAAYGVGATGTQETLLDPLTGGDPETGGWDHFDVVQYDLVFDMVGQADTVTFEVVFGSEEYWEFVGSIFIDGFGLYVNGENIAYTGTPPNEIPLNIDHPEMKSHPEDPTGGEDPAPTTNPLFGGTELDGVLAPGGNPVLTFSKYVGAGTVGNTLTFILADTSDAVLDTTVYISSLGGTTSNPIDVTVQPSATGKQFTNHTGTQTGLVSGDTAVFDVEFTGTGAGDAYELQFVNTADSSLLGTIPVTINNDYFYLVQAVDPDGDEITYSLKEYPEGATIDPDTALIQWDPPAVGDYEFLVRVEDGRGGFDEQRFLVTVTDSQAGNDPPEIHETPDLALTGQINRTFEYAVDASDPDGDALKYYLTTKPNGMSIHADTGVISWVPVPGQENLTHSVTVQVFDRGGLSDSWNFSVTVEPQDVFVNTQPEITTTAPTAAVVDELYVYDVDATDAESDDLTYSLPLGPEGAGIDPETGAIVWRPRWDQVGQWAFSVSVEDEHGGVDSQVFFVDVLTDNEPPEITSTPVGAALGLLWTYELTATDPNGDLVTFKLKTAPDGMTLDSATNTVSWTPAAVGDYRVEILAEDGRGGAYLQSFTLPVRDNAPPEITSIPTNPALVGELYTYLVEYNDPNAGDAVVLSLDQDSLDRGITLTGDLLEWTPTQIGDYPIVITADDQNGGTFTQSFTLQVRAPVVPSEPPVITSKPTGPAYEGVDWTYTVTATDPDDDDSTLVYTLKAPTGLNHVTWDPATHTVTWTPQASEVPDGLTFTVRVTDPAGSWREQTFTVPVSTASPDNLAPTITSIPTGPAPVDTLYEYQAAGHDPNGHTLVWSLDPLSVMGDMQIDPDTGLFTWTPTAAGSYDITIYADDQHGGTASQTFTLPVVVPNDPPEITSAPTGPAYVDEQWSYQITATDPQNDSLQFFLDEPTLPYSTVEWDPSGLITWTPQAGELDTELTFVVRVIDGNGGEATQTFTIPVARRNTAPEITSMPAGPAVVDQPWSYTIAATDAENDPLTYSLVSPELPPTNVGFDPATRTLTWTPEAADVPDGLTFTVRVDDDRGGYATQTFTIPVVSAAPGTGVPVITSTPEGPVYVNEPWTYQVVAEDPDGHTKYYSIDSDPANPDISIDSTGLVTWTPLAEGTFEVTVSVTDNIDGTATQTFTLTAVKRNQPPVVTSTPSTPTTVGRQWTYLVQADDPDGHALAYDLDQASKDRGATVDEFGRVTWTPTAVGSFGMTVLVDDGHGAVVPHDFTLAVVNTAPDVLSQPTGPAYVGTTWSYQLAAEDADGHDLAYTLTKPVTPPDDMHLDPDTGLLTWTPAATGEQEIEITISDGFGGVRTQSFKLPVQASAPSDDAPVIRSLPSSPVRLGEVFTYQVDAYDPNGDELQYALTTWPGGMTIDEQGLVTWRPEVLGDYAVEIVVSDPAGNQTPQPFTLQVIEPVALNDPPKITSKPTGPALRDVAWQYQATASDPNGHTVIWSLDPSAIPSEAVGDLAINATTGLLTWTPTIAGSYEITIHADDQHGAVIPQSFTLTVLQNAPPKITSDPLERVDLGTAYEYQVVASDPNVGDTLSYALEQKPEGMEIGTGGLITWATPVQGSYDISVAVSDQDGATARQRYTLRVVDPANNNPPQVTDPLRTRIQAGRTFLYQWDVTDPDGDPLTFTLVSGPPGMTMDDHGLIQWATTTADIDSSPHFYTVRVDDGRTDGLIEKQYQISVVHEDVNGRPKFDNAPTTNLIAGVKYVYDADATDPDGDTLVYSLVDPPRGMTIDSQSGLVEWTPTLDDLGEHTLTVRVVDVYGAGEELTVTLTVRSSNRAPKLESDPPPYAVLNEQYVFDIKASDPDEHALTFELDSSVSVPGTIEVVTVDPTTGKLTWTPTDTGVYQLQVNIYDELGLGIGVTFKVEVLSEPPNDPPQITTEPQLKAEWSDTGFLYTYTYDVDATDPNAGDTISYELIAPETLLNNMAFNTSTGLLEWTPDKSLEGQLVTIEVRALDQAGAYDGRRFDVLVTAPNLAPVIDPLIPDQTVTAGAVFRDDVPGDDPNPGDVLTYALDQASLDRGMTIDKANGLIEWATSAAHISATPYTVFVTVTDDRGLSATDDFGLLVTKDEKDPTATIVLSHTEAGIGQEVTIKVDADDDLEVTGRTLTLVSVELDGVVTTLNQDLVLDGAGVAKLVLQPEHLGTLTFAATARDAAGNVGPAPDAMLAVTDPNDGNPPTATITSLTEKQKITQPIDVRGSINDDVTTNLSWTLTATPLDASEITQPVVIASGTGVVQDGILGRFDPTLLRNGFYRLELTATDSGGNPGYDSVIVEVEGNLKLGNFTLSFVDLQVPVAGMPITITRTYDTLNADVQGDFGYGWTLDLSNTKVAVDHGESVDVGLFGYTPFQDGTRVVVTLPDGTKEGFTFYGESATGGFPPSADYLPKFRPDAGVTSELIVDGRYIRQLGSGYIDMETGRDYTPVDPILGGAYQPVEKLWLTAMLRYRRRSVILDEDGD